MALILALETSTPVGSVALFENNTLIASTELHLDKSHSRALLPAIDHLLFLAEKNKTNLSAVAISAGPGSYTGLRIGLATAKGICSALNIPLISVNSLLAMAEGIRTICPPNSLLCPMIDARRMEVYAAIYDANGHELLGPQPEIITESSFEHILKQNPNAYFYFFGNGSEKCLPIAEKSWPKSRPLTNQHPLAKNMGSVAYTKYQQKNFENITDFQPLYLKEFMIGKPKTQ